MQLPDYDIEITVQIRADRSIQLDGQQATTAELAQRIDEIAGDRRVRLEVLIWPPQDNREAFLSFIKAVQAELRKAESPVVTGFHTQRR